ncbi:hypothetical protein BDF22DRAFT_739816 [Syncephalis plumigaleata]|nr:hypothetical protein BDF22DRAFT_739816 [Syncephalis plumigaleata]
MTCVLQVTASGLSSNKAVSMLSKIPLDSALLLRKILSSDDDDNDDSSVSLAKIACLVNEERTTYGLSPVSVNRILSQAAQKHTVDQAQRHEMTHTGSDGSRPSQRVRQVGYDYRAVGECVAFGYETEAEVMRAWMNSPPHRAIILDRTYRELGIGYARSADSVPYWTIDFGMNENSPVDNVVACPTELDSSQDSPTSPHPSLTTETSAALQTNANQKSNNSHRSNSHHKSLSHGKKNKSRHRHRESQVKTSTEAVTPSTLELQTSPMPSGPTPTPQATEAVVSPPPQCGPECCLQCGQTVFTVSLIGNTPAAPVPTASATDTSDDYDTDESREAPLFNRLVSKLRWWLSNKQHPIKEQPHVNPDPQTIDLPRVRQLLRLASTSHRGTSSVKEHDVGLW